MTNIKDWLKEFEGTIIEREEVSDMKLTDLGQNEVYLNIIPDALPPSGSSKWEDIENWGFKLTTTYNPKSDEWRLWREFQADGLYAYLRSFDVIVSYNWFSFDQKILSIGGNSKLLPAFSVMDHVKDKIGKRIKLQNLSNQNGCNGTKLDLGEFLRSKPKMSDCIGYNVNKIKSLNHVMTTAIETGELKYWGVGEDRSQQSFNTADWGQLFSHARVRF